MCVCVRTLEVRGQCSVISLIAFHLYFEIRSLSLATLALSSTAPLVSTSPLTPGEDLEMHAAMSSFHRTQHNCVCVCIVCAQRPEEGVTSPGARVTSVNCLRTCWKSNLGPTLQASRPAF